MKVLNLDHLVITTADLKRCLYFYGDILGMDIVERDGKYAIFFGNQKFNIHTKPAEFLPAAEKPTYGSLDICLVVKPRAYIFMIFWSISEISFYLFLIIWGSKVEFLSWGTSTWNSPKVERTFFFFTPLR